MRVERFEVNQRRELVRSVNRKHLAYDGVGSECRGCPRTLLTMRLVAPLTWTSRQSIAVSMCTARSVLDGYVVLPKEIQPLPLLAYRFRHVHKIRQGSMVRANNYFPSEQILPVLLETKQPLVFHVWLCNNEPQKDLEFG